MKTSNNKRFAGKLYEVIIGVEGCSIKIANNHHVFKVSKEDALLAIHIDEVWKKDIFLHCTSTKINGQKHWVWGIDANQKNAITTINFIEAYQLMIKSTPNYYASR